MDAAELERVYEAFQEFHAYFAPAFGRKQWREHSGRYLQALLVQSEERRNAENLSEAVASPPRAMQYVLDVRPDMTVWPLEATWTNPSYQGVGRPCKPRLRREERKTMTPRSLALPAEAWQEITIAAGSQGPRTYRFSAQRGGQPVGASPARRSGQSIARTGTAANPATTCPTLLRTPLGGPGLCGRLPMAH